MPQSLSSGFKSRRHKPLALALSFTLVVLVAFAIAGNRAFLFATIVVSTTLAAVTLQRLFPLSRLLWIAFINLIAVYASVFALFVDEVFSGVGAEILSIGFALPIAFFLIGCWWRRNAILTAVEHPALRADRLLGRFVWLFPVFLVGAAVLGWSMLSRPLVEMETVFLVAMLLIGVIVVGVSRDVAVFLVDTGLLFEEFFQRVAHLLVPAFAFLTFYSLLVVIFASFYAIVSRFSHQPQFRIGDQLRPLSFPEALHFSAVTVSTVGYGDIVPLSSLSRTLAGIEVLLGVMLLLFGVSEILEYTKEQRSRRRREGGDGG